MIRSDCTGDQSFILEQLIRLSAEFKALVRSDRICLRIPGKVGSLHVGSRVSTTPIGVREGLRAYNIDF